MARKKGTHHSGTQPRKRADGRWEARYSVGIDPATGKTIQKSIYASTKAECAQKLREAVHSLDTGSYHEPHKMKFKEWLELWFDEYCINIKESTRGTYETQLRVHIIPALGEIRLCDLQTTDVQKFINALWRGSKKKKAVSPKTVKNVYGVLHNALKKAVEIRYLKSNPADGCTLPRIQKSEIKPLDDAMVVCFLQEIKGHVNEYALYVDLFTGLRKSELLGLTWDCIDFENGTMRVYRQLQFLKGKYSFEPLKNDKPRTLQLSKQVIDVLHAQSIKQKEMRLQAGSLWENKENFVFTDAMGHHLLHQTVYKRFKRIAEKIGIPSARFHDLRHSYAVIGLKSGADIKTIQENLGHATPTFTLDIYGHATDDMKKAAATRLEAVIASYENPA